jgi:putative ABC transport system substrate-binding protein
MGKSFFDLTLSPWPFALSLAGALVFALCSAAEAQQLGKTYRIGYLSGGSSSPPEAFVQGLRDRGYVEGKNITIEHRSGGKSDVDADILADLIRLKVAVIVVETSGAALAAKKATHTIPIVMTTSTDPVGTGLIASFARPGGNVTGLTSLSVELGGKLLELLKEIVPGLSRVAIPAPATSTTEDLFIKETEGSARVLKVQLIRIPVPRPEDYDRIFRVATKEQANALLVRIPASTPARHRKRFVELAVKNRLPAIYTAINWIEVGGLMSYGQNRNAQFQRVAAYVDKILKGANPADLPVEAPKDFDLVVNLTAAKRIGLTIPQSVLYRADRVIR